MKMYSKCITVINFSLFGRFPWGRLSGHLSIEKVPKCSTVVDFRAFYRGVGAISVCHPRGFPDTPRTLPRRLRRGAQSGPKASPTLPGRSQDAPGTPPRAGNGSPDAPIGPEEPPRGLPEPPGTLPRRPRSPDDADPNTTRASLEPKHHKRLPTDPQGRLGAVLGGLGAVLRPSWGRLGPSWAGRC